MHGEQSAPKLGLHLRPAANRDSVRASFGEPLVDERLLPARDRQRLGLRGDEIPERLDVGDLLFDWEVVEPRGRRDRCWHSLYSLAREERGREELGQAVDVPRRGPVGRLRSIPTPFARPGTPAAGLLVDPHVKHAGRDVSVTAISRNTEREYRRAIASAGLLDGDVESLPELERLREVVEGLGRVAVP